MNNACTFTKVDDPLRKTNLPWMISVLTKVSFGNGEQTL